MKEYLIYDGRYWTDPDRATVFSVCGSLAEAKAERNELFPGSVIVEYKQVNGTLYETGNTF